MTWQLTILCYLFLLQRVAFGKNLVLTTDQRDKEISKAIVYNDDEATHQVAGKDLLNGPPNPYGIKTFEEIECEFVEPSKDDPIGGTTPKFHCDYMTTDGKNVTLKIKYDQAYNEALQPNHCNHNEEVYANIVSQRILWATGFGTDQAIPVSVKCYNCPIEPWTYVLKKQGYTSENIASGWMDMRLIESGKWDEKRPVIALPLSIVEIKLSKYIDADDIVYMDKDSVTQTGFGWKELFEKPTTDHHQQVAREALTVIASFLSHCDNFDGNQGFLCVYSDGDGDDGDGEHKKIQVDKTPGKDKNKDNNDGKCKGVPLMYIHDVGGTLGYGWSLLHLDFWPDYFHLKEWSDFSIWGDLKKCQVQVHGLPGCSWTGNLQVTEEGRALAAGLLSQLTDKQIEDLFTAARANFMRGESIADWINGFKNKLHKDVLQSSCVF